jgi:hypothetical protein
MSRTVSVSPSDLITVSALLALAGTDDRQVRALPGLAHPARTPQPGGA